MQHHDVIIVGAGPYGLSAAAHLAAIPGLEFRVFGEPMSFWDRHMPAGMFLRSNWTATEIASPDDALTLEAFQAASGTRFSTPVPLENFVDYGRWYQRQAAPDLDSRKIMRIEAHAKGFCVLPERGDSATARRVVIAAGIGSFARRPSEFDGLPAELVSHASEHRDFNKFAGRKVLVLGSGQSALESAALLHEGGAQVEVVGRARQIHWLQGRLSKFLHHGAGKFARRLLYAPTDVGPAGLSQLLARPDWLRLLPRGLQDKLRKRAVRPAGARWLVTRLADVPIALGRSTVSVAVDGGQVKLKLDDGSERSADHVLLGTGYRPDISKYEFLSPGLVQGVDRVQGFPRLQAGLESSVPGLHFLGAPAAWSFGPLMQFVSGTRYASRSLSRSVGKSVRP
ncbi:MAG: NAD(P)-binding domain-containing protein [Opitutaceae bacterium]|jgi:cation diffusion facilitator CzcD-associated flavoprotein CzcO